MLARILLAAIATVSLASCTTTSGSAKGGLAARWTGKEAGKFFAAYGPPTADEESGSTTTYNWRGGYKTRHVPATYKGEGKSKKLVSRAHTDYLVCQVKLTVGEDYRIKSITALVDKPGTNGGPSWCEEFLDAAK